jgi:hypothetical protein
MFNLKIISLYAYFLFPHNLFIKYEFLSGIKPTDIIILLLLLLFIFNKKQVSIPSAFLLLPFWYIISSIISFPNLGFISLAFGFKFFEYLIVLFSISSLQRNEMLKLLNMILIFTFLFVFLEFIGIYWGPDWGGRYSSNFGGPYELGAIALVLSYLYKNYFIRSGLFGLLILSEAKASILGLIISYSPIKNINLTKVFILLLLSFIAFMNSRVQDLFSSIFIFINSNVLEMIDAVPYSSSNTEYINNWLLREEYSQFYGLDWSTGSRIYTYILAIKSIDLFGIIFGMGPGYYGFAIDSSILRIFVETGIVGIIFFIIFYNKIFSRTNNNKIKLAVLINLLLVDVFFSARFFPIIFLCYSINFNIKE